MKNIVSIIFLTFILAPHNLSAKFREIDVKECHISKNSYYLIIEQVKKKNYNALTSPKECIKRNQKLVFEACLIDPKQLQYALDIFRSNENFVYRLIKVHPEALQYASVKLRNDPDFIEKTLFINRDALKYASKELKDNLQFMRKVIGKDSRNYIYASSRIKAIPEIAKIAFKDNGNLILYAPQKVKQNKELVKIALKSSSDAFEFLDKELRHDTDLIEAASYQKYIFSKDRLEKHIMDHYIIKPEEGEEHRGLRIDNNFADFEKNRLINRNYVTKWHKSYKLRGLYLKENWRLISLDNRNYLPEWKKDLRDYPKLVEKIDRFFKRRYIDENTINNLRMTYLWNVQDQPKTLAFNLYLLRDSKDIELSESFANVTSLTAIARQTKDKKNWRLSVIEVIFDKEIRTDIAYQHAHKRYFIQDLYLHNKKDKNPKIIFRVEDRFDNYFEIYSKMSADKYQLSYRIDPDKIKEHIDYNEIDVFGVKRSRHEQEEYEWEEMMEDCLYDPKCAEKVK